ncbi:MAG: hypothetical protein J3Q66DRAFT_375642 [Benniella sp.]|nr:MAG: hypothetical protein J3Q66DRAFT_375642 [Benniella sp.]
MLQGRQVTRQAALLFLLYITPILVSLSPNLSAYAQPFKPYLTTQPGNAFVDGKALYILNGRTVDGVAAQQAFMIDLSVSWNTSSPAYKMLSSGPGADRFPTAMSADGQKWFALVDGVGHVYDVQSNYWVQVFNSSVAQGISGHAAATDPETGKVYIPFAYRKPDGTFNMLVVDLKDGSNTSDNKDFTLPEQSSYAVAWSAHLKSLLFLNDNGMYSYNPLDGWKNFNGPPGLTATSEFCMVSSGSKVVVFGGYSKSSDSISGDIFILDVPTLTWKKGPSTSPHDVRRSPACALSNGQFVAWGGDASNGAKVVPPNNMVLIYDIKTDAWGSDYTPPTTSASEKKPGLSKAWRTILIVVGAIIGVIVLGFCLWVCLIMIGEARREARRRKEARRRAEGGGGGGGGGGRRGRGCGGCCGDGGNRQKKKSDDGCCCILLDCCTSCGDCGDCSFDD